MPDAARESFVNELNNQTWSSTLSKPDVEKPYEEFQKIFQGIFNKHFPIKVVKLKDNICPKKPRITNGLIKSTKTKTKLYRKFLCKPTEFNRTKHKIFRNKLNHLIRVSKKRHFQKRLNDAKADLKSTWKILN